MGEPTEDKARREGWEDRIRYYSELMNLDGLSGLVSYYETRGRKIPSELSKIKEAVKNTFGTAQTLHNSLVYLERKYKLYEKERLADIKMAVFNEAYQRVTEVLDGFCETAIPNTNVK